MNILKRFDLQKMFVNSSNMSGNFNFVLNKIKTGMIIGCNSGVTTKSVEISIKACFGNPDMVIYGLYCGVLEKSFVYFKQVDLTRISKHDIEQLEIIANMTTILPGENDKYCHIGNVFNKMTLLELNNVRFNLPDFISFFQFEGRIYPFIFE